MSLSSTDTILDLKKQIHEFKTKSKEIKKRINIIQQQLQDIIYQDKQNLTNRLEHYQNDCLENDIERLRKEIEELQSKLEEINHENQTRSSTEQLHMNDMNIQSNNLPQTMKSSSTNLVSANKKNCLRSVVDISRNSAIQQADDTTALPHRYLKQMNPLIIDINENERVLTDEENETYLFKEEEMIGVIDSNTTSRISHKIRLSHNYIRWIRGPAKIMMNGMTHVADVYTQGIHINGAVVQAIKQGLDKQKQNAMTKNSLKSAFTEITPDWTFEGENADRGFISVSIWMRDPQGRRILVKTHGHPLSAVNEWLAYILGRSLGLPVNEVQIAIYLNKLVSLHTDIANENEKTITFMDLPKQTRKSLLTYSIMESMDLFDHIIQNVDRTPRNILITMPNTTAITDDTSILKIHLIDHSFCFGVGKRDVISAIACKLHSKYLSVVKFDPIDEGRKFEQYLNKLPIADRTIIRNTLNRFAAITDDQFDSWMNEVRDLLSSSQYNRIHDVLCRQRDIAKYYTVQWGICPTYSSIKPNEANQPTHVRDK
ncbi:unnamed protein product [Rotaria sordida]|uniref:Uncharacterized protein n=1 Tax=Rotaria sordida TaxID=392033 RepID=A0A814MQK3_9BILA|nr:unnamed protein product [Rotaria sordida]